MSGAVGTAMRDNSLPDLDTEATAAAFVHLVLTDYSAAMRAEVEGIDLQQLRAALLRIATSPPGCPPLDPDGVQYRDRAFLRIQQHLDTARSAHSSVGPTDHSPVSALPSGPRGPRV